MIMYNKNNDKSISRNWGQQWKMKVKEKEKL